MGNFSFTKLGFILVLASMFTYSCSQNDTFMTPEEQLQDESELELKSSTATINYDVTSSITAIPIELSDFGPNPVLLDFDELESGTSIGELYLSQGTLFENTLAVNGTFPVSAPNVIVSASTLPVGIHFPSGITKVGIKIDGDGYALDRQPQMRVFDENDIILGIQNFAQGPDFVGFAFSQPIQAYVKLGSTPYNDPSGPFVFTDAYDNLIFELAKLTIDAVTELVPETLNLKSNGTWISAFIELPEGYNVLDIEINSIQLVGTISAELHPKGVGDADHDGIADLMVKFSREAIIEYLSGTTGSVLLSVTGDMTNEIAFESFASLKVIDP
ncbi:MAG: hypothetical protein DWQ05_07465 [Calditrichaeota bacterium]|nr:MAG: hypothetical protein DWQ05_07465 [Calditrichota bacterium]